MTGDTSDSGGIISTDDVCGTGGTCDVGESRGNGDTGCGCQASPFRF